MFYHDWSTVLFESYGSVFLQVQQNGCRNTEDFIKKMERWKPLIWCILYDAVGWPES
ncbi:hypothetical protein BRADI_1g72718v3 [Brachypodium distachyon]|uniref:Uncharacterized protein n=1 Tax=Brachypodium distachyon TaxID=15368 RepID=A0A2K2DUS9_BRADI|nr:hypothetical protein BRADI_1g72718v3 [Brachypodium distachyon]